MPIREMASDGPSGALTSVKAIYTFKGTNNDELNFSQGDVITITQMPDGGWWEGTLMGVTGWFPSNHVKEFKNDMTSDGKSAIKSKLNDVLSSRQENLKKYRNVVLTNIIESETQHISELLSLQRTYLHPLQMSEILLHDEYVVLVGNLNDVIEEHQKLLSSLQLCNEVISEQQKIGGTFMLLATQIKAVHSTYCGGHPKAVLVLEKYRTELNGFMESHGAPPPGYRFLTTGLSLPFRRLEKYYGLLLELEHHTEENHSDRGDTQRAAHIYKEIAETCSNVRRQKEMELEILRGNIRGWEGEEVQNLGDIILMTQGIILTENQERRERHLILFSCTLLICSVSLRKSAFVYEGKLPLAGINVACLEDTDSYQHAFEITGNMIDRIIVLCHSNEEQQKWTELMKRQIRLSRTSGTINTKLTTPISPHYSMQSQQGPSLDNKSQAPMMPFKQASQVWSGTCLRPAPPIRPCLALGSKDEASNGRRTGSRYHRFRDDRSFEDDARILQVIEAYCNSVKTRYTVNSTLLDSPQVLIAEEEKIINEVTCGKQTIVEEKSLVDTVYALKDQMKELQQETLNLSKNFDEEQKSRRKLEDIIRKYLLPGRDDIKWDE